MQCDLVAQGPTYQSRQTHTWELTGGAPDIRGAIEVRAATWTVSGGGSLQTGGNSQTWVTSVPPTPAPLSTFIRASDGRRLIQSGHSQLQAPNALTITAQPSAATARPAVQTLSVFEWAFPIIDDAGSSTTLKGSNSAALTTRMDRMQAAPGTQGTANCTWYFSASERVPPPPPVPALEPAPGFTSRDSVIRPTLQARTAPTADQASATPPAPTSGTVVSPRTTPVSIDGAQNGATLSATARTGPAPVVDVTSRPLVAQFIWKAVDDTEYELYRWSGSETPVKVWRGRYSSLFNGENAGVSDVVPDYRVTYRYRVVANYRNGTSGESTAITFVSPPLVNPTGFHATQTPPSDVVTLQWDPIYGAVQYRIDGTGLDVGGKYLTETTVNISPITGAGSWQVAAIYPGNYADYSNRPAASVAPLPAHAPAWLSKHGAGSAAETAAHYSQLCGPKPQPCHTLGEYLASWGTPSTIAGGAEEERLVTYDNVTDLGSPRATTCFFSEPMPGGGALICYANTGNKVSLIVMANDGARFAVFEQPPPKENDIYTATFPNAALIDTAVFDTEGPKHAPHACIACHGGTYDPGTRLVQGATLLPIDPGLVRIVGDRAVAEEKIRVINSMIRQSPHSSGAVRAYIDGLYGGMDGTQYRVDQRDARATPDFAPQGWTQQRSLYLDFVKKDCAICHLAGEPSLNFLSAGNFMANKDLIYTSVCRSHSMPHAQTAYINFWTSGSANVSGPGWFAAALGFAGCPEPVRP